jgi:hypothetical protein
MLLPGRGDSEEPTGEATTVPAMTGNDRRPERSSNDEPDGTAQATTGLATLRLTHLQAGLTRIRSNFAPFKTQFLNLIRVEFTFEKKKIDATMPSLAPGLQPDKPKLLDQRVKASLTRQE